MAYIKVNSVIGKQKIVAGQWRNLWFDKLGNSLLSAHIFDCEKAARASGNQFLQVDHPKILKDAQYFWYKGLNEKYIKVKDLSHFIPVPVC